MGQAFVPCLTHGMSFHLACVVLFEQNAQNPVEDFRRTPPGILALSNMVYFAKNYRENYTKVSSVSSDWLVWFC